MAKVIASQKIQQKVMHELNKLKEHSPDYMKKSIDEAQEKIMNEIQNQTGVIEIEGFMKQEIFINGAGLFTDKTQARFWYKYHIIALMLSDSDFQELLKQKYGQEENHLFMEKFYQQQGVIERLKMWIEKSDPRKLENGDITSVTVRKVENLLTKFPIINKDLNEIFVTICRNTSIGNYTIPAQYMQMMNKKEKDITKLGEGQRRPSGMTERIGEP